MDWNSCRHKDYCNASNNDDDSTAQLRASRLFPEKEIVSEAEGRGEDGEEEDAQKAHTASQQQGGTLSGGKYTAFSTFLTRSFIYILYG